MKIILIYLAIGCIIYGTLMFLIENDCVHFKYEGENDTDAEFFRQRQKFFDNLRDTKCTIKDCVIGVITWLPMLITGVILGIIAMRQNHKN